MEVPWAEGRPIFEILPADDVHWLWEFYDAARWHPRVGWCKHDDVLQSVELN